MKKHLLLFYVVLFNYCSFAQIVPSYLPANGLINYWGFENTLIDYTINNNDGTVIGNSTFTVDRFGNINSAFELTNNSDIICTTNTNNNIQLFTISLWFKSTNSGFLFGQNNGQCSHGGLWDRNLSILPNGNLEFYIFNGSQQYTTAIGNYKDNNWHNVVVNLSNNGTKIYIDGILSSQNSTITTAQNYLGYWRVGGLQTGGNNTIIGNIDDIAIWDRELTSSEISTIYQESLLNINNFTLTNFKIYPNPITDILFVENLDIFETIQYQIFDQLGREIKKGILIDKLTEINFSEFNSGFYILKIQNKSIKLIKN